MVTYPEGTYKIRITATTGTSNDVSKYHDFTLLMTDPCPTSLDLLTTPFSSATYTLQDSTISQSWSAGLAQITAGEALCGTMTN